MDDTKILDTISSEVQNFKKIKSQYRRSAHSKSNIQFTLETPKYQWSDTWLKLESPNGSCEVRLRWLFRPLVLKKEGEDSSSSSASSSSSSSSASSSPLGGSGGSNTERGILSRQQENTTTSLRDRFGFVENSPDIASSAEYRLWMSQYLSHEQRVIHAKWEDFLKSNPLTFQRLEPQSESTESYLLSKLFAPGQRRKMMQGGLKNMCRMGVPTVLRPQIWGRYATYAIARNPGVYQQLLVDYTAQRRANGITETASQIEKDLTRTFPGHPIYTSREGLAALRRVLLAYSVYNPHLGYCQSMNFICAILLLFLEEEQAFWTVVYITKEELPLYYTAHMIGVKSDIAVLSRYFRAKMPALYSHLQSLEIDLGMIATEWFLTAFSNALPSEILFRVYDVFLTEGASALFRVALSLFKTREKELLSLKSFESCYRVLKSLPNQAYGQRSSASNPEPKLLRKAFSSKFGRKLSKFASVRAASLAETEMNLSLTLFKSAKGIVDADILPALFTEYRDTRGSLFNGINFDQFVFITGKVWPGTQLLTTEELEKMFRSFDSNQDGYLDVRELVAGMSLVVSKNQESGCSPDDTLLYLFKAFDSDDDMALSFTEIGELVRHLDRIATSIRSTHGRRKRHPFNFISSRSLRNSLAKLSAPVSFEAFKELLNTEPFQGLAEVINQYSSVQQTTDSSSTSSLPIPSNGST